MINISISRTPQGVRGLKSGFFVFCGWCLVSHPARGAWIEIFRPCSIFVYCNSRTPQGVRGLKYIYHDKDGVEPQSHPARGAWIEIRDRVDGDPRVFVAPRKGCVD